MPQNFDATVTNTATDLDVLASPAFSKFPNRAKEVLVQADSANTAPVIWGDATIQNIEIAAGEEKVIPCSVIGEIFFKVSSGTEVIHCSWIN